MEKLIGNKVKDFLVCGHNLHKVRWLNNNLYIHLSPMMLPLNRLKDGRSNYFQLHLFFSWIIFSIIRSQSEILADGHIMFNSICKAAAHTCKL